MDFLSILGIMAIILGILPFIQKHLKGKFVKITSSIEKRVLFSAIFFSLLLILSMIGMGIKLNFGKMFIMGILICLAILLRDFIIKLL